MNGARCAGAPVSLFVPDTELDRPPPEVLAYCTPCPVAADCLAWALRWPATVGYFAGTSTRQRRSLRRPRGRLHCPLCGEASTVVEVDGGDQVCRRCAVSWRAA